ncbi:MAG: hypothetical protein NC394_01405 [Bacteroides sp.]|nr:hypothetical protein [Bacteroides sp.]
MEENYIADYISEYLNSPEALDIFAKSTLRDSVTELINIAVFLIDLTVLGLMLFRCMKFRKTRAYNDFAGSGKLAKGVEVITIFLAIDAVFSLTRLFSLIDAVNLAKQIFPVFPASAFIFPIAVQIVLPFLACGASLFVWNMYHNTKKLFFSMYPNGALPVIDVEEPKRVGEALYGSNKGPDLTYSAGSAVSPNQIRNMSDSFDAYYENAVSGAGKSSAGKVRDEDIFGTGASIGYLSSVSKEEEAKMEDLLIQEEPPKPIEEEKTSDGGDDDIFGTGNSSDWQPMGDLNDPSLADMLVSGEEQETEDIDGGLFGTGTASDYMNVDEAKIAELLVQDE